MFRISLTSAFERRPDTREPVAIDPILGDAAAAREAVDLSACDRNGRVDIAVADDGSEIHETEGRVITEPDPETQLEHASGFGLWIVRATADALNGWLSIETTRATDESDGDSGTTVTLGVPAACGRRSRRNY